MKVDIHVDCVYRNTKPQCVFSCVTDSINKLLDHSNIVSLNFDLQSKDEIKIEFTNKDEQDDNVVIIKKIVVDDIDLQHYIYHGSFEPKYNKDWYAKQQVKPPRVYSPCTELRHNGVWNIKIETPVWKMIMNKWIQDER